MTESIETPLSRWHYGMHPQAMEMRIVGLGRVFLQLGEALRLEMAKVGPDGDDDVHLQYYVATELGPWAIWLSCAREDVEAAEAALREVTPPFTAEQTTQPPK